MAPVSNTSTPGHPRLAQLAHSSTSDSLSSLQNSPSTSRSSRNLGAIGGRAGPGYSPYARRVSRAVAAREEEEAEDDATIRGDESEVGDSPVQQRSGLFGRVKSLPGKALGWLTRSSSSRTLASSTSLADVRAEVEEEQAKERGVGIQRSKTASNLAGQAGGAPSALPSRLRRQPLQRDTLPSPSSMSALSSVASPFASSGLRSSHSTLNLASAASTGSGVPSFLTTSNLSRHSRAVSPALSSASYAHSRRSPSPMRNGLVGSMSTFNLAQPRSPTSAFGGQDTTLGNAALTNGSNPFGLTSRSPFAASGSRLGSQRAVSVAGSVRSSSTRPEGHALFPYTSTIPRGASPSIAASQSMREGLSSLASAASPQPNSAPSTAQKRPYARVGSPLNPRSPFAYGEGGAEAQVNGVERARKKQMVWDPARGLISRERLEAEKERDAPPLPKNEAERILEVLEGMGRTPLGEAKRGAVRPKKISVPAPASPGLASRPTRTSNGPSTAPYSARTTSANVDTASSGKGLQSVLRAREERRRALIEQEREERRIDEERERQRAERRRELEQLNRAREDEELESVMSQDFEEEEEEERPRRRTRSSTAPSKSKSKSKNLEPPTPRRSTRASTRNVKSPSPAPTPKKKSKSKRVQEEENEDDSDMEPPASRQKRAVSKSPAPPSESTAERAQSESPPPPPKIVFPPPPAASSSSNPSQRSSLRPGKSHSSRQHTASSKVFSAREEDLPPIDDDALSKIQMPAMKFPQGFSFGGSTSSAPASKNPEGDAKVVSKGGESKDEGSSLLSRLSAAPVAKPSTDKPAFSFGGPTASTASTSTSSSPAASTIPPLPALSFGAAPANTKPAAAPSLFKPSSGPASDLFAPKPASTGFSFATPSTSTPAALKIGAATDGEKPNFFASIVKEKKDEAPKVAPLPSFSFGAATSTPVVKPTEVVTPDAGKEKQDAAPPAANPFAAFGKPVSEIIKESKAGNSTGEDKGAEEVKIQEAPKAAFSFGTSTKPAEKTDTTPSTGSMFSFKPTPPTSTPAASSSFTFGASKPAEEAKKTETPAPAFSFGATSNTAPVTSTPKATFTFGTTPATPTTEEKASTPVPSAPASPFGSLAPPAPASVAGTDDADGDSGMEDEAEPAASSTLKPAAPTPFTFGSAAPSASTSSGLFGAPSGSSAPASTGFTFGTNEKKEASPSPFGAPAATSSSTSLFGGASSTASKPFTFGSPSPSPAPQSPSVASASTPFSFGQPATLSNVPTSTFSFGASSGSNPSPFGAPSQPASPAPAPASTGFSFGASSSNPPASSTAPFSFGAAAPSANSSSMGQTLSAPGTNGAPSPFGAAAPANGGGFTFGASSSQPVSPSASTSAPSFNFGAPAAGNSSFSFGASSAAPASPFGAPSPAAGAGGGGFSFGAPSGSGATTPTGGGLFNLGSGGEDAAKSGRPIRPLRRRK